ncbi:hypothetical protein HYT33_01800 [Candidatus Roizmanbacteria bacterium]|nr:hypothetical protein [Candidatus Roizmanbacteria bacterium]
MGNKRECLRDIPPGTQNITWSSPTQPNLVTQYAVRIEDQTDGTQQGGAASVCGKTQGRDGQGDECFTTSRTFWSYTFEVGHTYLVWVHGGSCNTYGDSRSVTIRVIAPYPSVTIQGALKEYNTTSCSAGIETATPNFITVTPQNRTGVTSSCTISPSTGTTKTSYSCTVNFDAYAGADCSQNLTLAARPVEYQQGYLVDQGVCQATGNNTIAVDVCGANPTILFNKDFLFQVSGPWVKLKNSSFSAVSALSNPIPALITAFDQDDDAAQRVFIVGGSGSDPGVVAATSINTGTAKVSQNEWARGSYETASNLSPKSYREYLKTRKDYQTISNLSAITEGGKTYFWQNKDDPVVISDTSAFDGKDNVVLVTAGEIQINADFKPTSAVALVATTITFADTVKEARGVFVADTIDTGTNTANGLKITGNLNAKSAFQNKREVTDNSKPAVFIVFDPELFIKLLPSLSTAKYEYQQKQ